MSDFGYGEIAGVLTGEDEQPNNTSPLSFNDNEPGLSDPGNQTDDQLVIEAGLGDLLPDPGDLLGETTTFPEPAPILDAIHSTFPRPEIVSLSLLPQAAGVLTRVFQVKVKITGDFLSDEWFWADFLEYFKLEVAFVPFTNGLSSQLKETSLFNYKMLFKPPLGEPTEFFSNERTKQSDYSLAISDLERLPLRDRSEFIFIGKVQLGPTYFSDANYEHYVVSRTYFDKEKFQADFYGGKDISGMSGMNEKLISFLFDEKYNGLWDAVKVFIDGSSGEPENFKKIVAQFNTAVRWNGAFSYFKEADRFYVPAGVEKPAFRFINQLTFEEQSFAKNDNSSKLTEPIKQKMQEEQKKLVLDLRKRIELIDPSSPVSNAYYSKQIDGQVKVCFSIDFLDLLRQNTNLPESILDYIKSGIVGDTVKNFQIYDKTAKDLTYGRYEYNLELEISERFNSSLLSLVEKLKSAQRDLNDVYISARNPNMYNASSDEFSLSAVATNSPVQKRLTMSAEAVYDGVQFNFLEDFSIDAMVLKRKRIQEQNFKQKKDILSGEQIIFSYTEGISFLRNEISIEGFEMFSIEDISYQPSNTISKEDFLKSYELENTNIEQLKNLESNIEDLIKIVVDTTGVVDAKEKSVNNLSNNLKDSKFIPTTSKFVFNDVFIPEDYMGAFQYDEETLFQAGEQSLEKEASFSFPDGVVYKIISSPAGDELENKKFKSIEALDQIDNDFVFPQDSTKLKRNVILEQSLSSLDMTVPTALVRLEYLSGYENNSNGVEKIMKKPIFLEYDSEELEVGRTYLFKVQAIEKDSESSIYNEYFVKKV